MVAEPDKTREVADILQSYGAGHISRRTAFRKLIGANIAVPVIVTLIAVNNASAQNSELQQAEAYIGARASPLIYQLEFLADLMRMEKERDDFIRDPVKFGTEKGIVFDPAVIRTVVDAVVLLRGLSYDSEPGRTILTDPRSRYAFQRLSSPPTANAVAVAGAVSIVAAAAVAYIAYTVITSKRDLYDRLSRERRHLLPDGRRWADN